MAGTSAQQQEGVSWPEVTYRIIDHAASLIQTGLWVSCVGIVAWCFLQAIRALAGQQTHAQIGIGILGNVQVSQGIFALFGAGGIVYGLRERTLRRNTIGRHAKKMQDLERQYDPIRGTSGLDERGRTAEQDR
jgi:hypothetical protein